MPIRRSITYMLFGSLQAGLLLAGCAAPGAGPISAATTPVKISTAATKPPGATHTPYPLADRPTAIQAPYRLAVTWLYADQNRVAVEAELTADWPLEADSLCPQLQLSISQESFPFSPQRSQADCSPGQEDGLSLAQVFYPSPPLRKGVTAGLNLGLALAPGSASLPGWQDFQIPVSIPVTEGLTFSLPQEVLAGGLKGRLESVEINGSASEGRVCLEAGVEAGQLLQAILTLDGAQAEASQVERLESQDRAWRCYHLVFPLGVAQPKILASASLQIEAQGSQAEARKTWDFVLKCTCLVK